MPSRGVAIPRIFWELVSLKQVIRLDWLRPNVKKIPFKVWLRLSMEDPWLLSERMTLDKNPVSAWVWESIPQTRNTKSDEERLFIGK